MTIRIEEAYGGKRESGPGKFTREVEYNIIGTCDADEAYNEFYRHIMNNAGYMAGLPLETISVDGDKDGARFFTGVAKYSNRHRNRLDVGIPHYSFSTKGGSAKVVFAKKLVESYGPTPPNFGVGINYSDYRFEGVEIIVPKWVETVKVAWPRTLVNYQFKAMLRRLTGRFNSYPFLGMAPGECLFNGVDCTEGERQDTNGNNFTLIYEMAFEFLGMPNVVQTIPGIGSVAKRGWDFVWIYHGERADPLANRVVKYPRNAYVEQVYDEADFNVLGF